MPTTNTIQAVVFDMDGTIVDSEPVYRYAWLSAAREFGQEIPIELYNTFVGIDTATCEAMLRPHVGEDFPMATFRARWQTLFREEILAGRMNLKPGFNELYDRLRTSGVKLAVATGSGRAEVDLIFPNTGLEGTFQVVVTSDDVENCKPAPDLYLLAGGELGIPAEALVVFEDTNHGVNSALAAGAQVVMVPDVQSPDPEVARQCLAVLESLQDAIPLLKEWGVL